MPYRNANLNFVIDSHFQPFSMQEMLVPFTAYKEEFEKTETAYQDLADKSDKFKYLSEQLPEGSKARQIYEGYANTLASQAEDLAMNGLSMGNRRALTSLKRRYQGEIGRLDIAQTALEKEKEMRRARGLQDSSMLYAVDNMTVDDFLDGKNPNLYGISGNELYTRGAAAGKAASSRVFSAGDGGKTLGGYYRDYVEKMGYNADTIAKFRADVSTIPELQQAADDILRERGVLQNLKDENLARARQSVINGMIDGAVYQEQHKPMQDLGVMTAAQVAADARQRESNALAREQFNFEKTKYNTALEKQNQLDRLVYEFDDKTEKIIGYKKDLGLPSGYWINPTSGKVEKKPAEAMTPEEKQAKTEADSLTKGLLALKGEDLNKNSGFDVTTGTNRYHYTYIGAVDKHKGVWRNGAIGDNVPGAGWGFTSASNVMSPFGNYSAEHIDSGEINKVRVLSSDEAARVLSSDMELAGAVQERVNAYKEQTGLDNFDIQLVEVPNEHGGARKGYLIAVH